MIMSMQKQHETYGERQLYQSLQDKASRAWVWIHLYSMIDELWSQQHSCHHEDNKSEDHDIIT